MSHSNSFVGLTLIVLLSLGSGGVLASEYFYSPMNFQSPTNHTVTVNLAGVINVSIPANFTLISGSPNGVNNVSFIVESPSISASPPTLHLSSISVDGSFYESFYFLSVEDSAIVDNKIEYGHGDFNYLDGTDFIGAEPSMIFSLVRVWPIGSDVVGESATDVRFNCTYPLIVPNTVDRKYDTTYGTDILASGSLGRMEGISMFRVFVISQEVNYAVGTSYEIACDTLRYNYTHTEVIASIPDFNLTARSLSPLIISNSNETGYVQYNILNNESYDLQNLEFLWSIGGETVRAELGSLDSGEVVQYQVPTNSSGSMTLKARFLPSWMFNSRAPTYYEQTNFASYYTPGLLEGLNTTDYYGNQSVHTPSILETQVAVFNISTFTIPPYTSEFQVVYSFYDSENVLQGTSTNTVTGVDVHQISVDTDGIEPSGLEEDYSIYSTVSIKDDEGEWYAFPSELIGSLTIGALTNNGAQTQVTVSSGTSGVTGSVVLTADRSLVIPWYIWLIIIVAGALWLMVWLTKRERSKPRKPVKVKSHTRYQ